MIDPSWDKDEVSDFGGEWATPDMDDIPSEKSLKCLNATFEPGGVSTRNGIASVWNPGDIVTSMFHWLYGDATSSNRSYLVYHKDGYGVRFADLSSPVASNLYAVAGAKGAVFAPAGSKFFSAHYNASGVGVDGGKVYGIGIGEDPLFAPPMLTSAVTIAAGAPSAGGQCTVGTRNIAFIMTTRNGFTGRASPCNTSLVVQPASVTTTAANKQFLVTVTPTPTWPAYAGTIQIVMTTTVDPSTYYFVPNTVLAVPAGGGIAVSTTISISDADLVVDAGFSDATPNFFLLTQSSAGVAPFNPSSVFVAGKRMAYVFRASDYGQGVFFSNPGKLQEINASKNLLQLPGQRQVTTGFYKDKTIYMVGPNWTYAVGDNGGYPVTWSSADLVDGHIGTSCPEGVSFDVARGVGWVAHTSGLYRFASGRYDSLPVSYMNKPIWDRINWAAAQYSLRVVDNVAARTVIVAAPLLATGVVNTNGTAVTWVSGHEFAPTWTAGTVIVINGVSYSIASVTSRLAAVLTATAGTQSAVSYSVTPSYNTHLLTWNYMSGDSWESAKFSLWFMQNVAPASIAIVQNYSTSRKELWIGQAAAGDIFRQKHDTESQIYRDGATAIDCVYRTGIFRGSGGTYTHHGSDVRVRGSGSMPMSFYSLDGVLSAVMSPITLSLLPGREYFRGCRMRAESGFYEVSNGAIIDTYFKLSLLRHYRTQFTASR